MKNSVVLMNIIVELSTGGESVVVPVCVARRMMSPAIGSSMKKAVVAARFIYRLLGMTTTSVTSPDTDSEPSTRRAGRMN